jgi:hypothetical protein
MTANWSGNPATWANGGLTAASLNTELRDRMDYLKAAADLHGLASAVTIGQVKSALCGVRALRTASQSIPDANPTFVQLTAADEFDSNAFHDPAVNSTRITIPAGLGGVYLFGGSVEWASNGTGRRLAEVILNGGSAILGAKSQIAAATGAPTRQDTGATVYLFVAGDRIEMNVTQNSGGALSLDTAVLWAVRLFATV